MMHRIGLLVLGLSTLAAPVRAVTRYVALSGSHTPPYTNWVTAATNLQAAVSACAPGDVVVATNGVYSTGGVVVFGELTNRVALTNGITLRSVNGPAVTTIVGQGPLGPSAVRCAWVASNAVLEGFTLSNGYTLDEGDAVKETCGGGVWTEYPGGLITNCVITGCSAANMGGGFYYGRVVGSVISNNSALFGGGGAGSSADLIDRCIFVNNRAVRDGGGLYSGYAVRNSHFAGNQAGERGGGMRGVWNVESCTVAGNQAQDGGGASGCTISNSIVYYNRDQFGSPNQGDCNVSYSCTTPDPGGTGNLTNHPGLAGLYNPHLVTNSPCIDAGTNSAWMAAVLDVDGEPRLAGRVDMGCDEALLSGMTLSVSPTVLQADCARVVVGVPVRFWVEIANRPVRYRWTFGDGQGASNQTVVEHAYAAPGTYVVSNEVWNLYGFLAVSRTVEVYQAFTNYVAPGGSHTAPFTNWSGAANNLQAAVSACAKGGTVLVSNGVYQSGGVLLVSSNRVAITNAMTVRSVNGPTQTVILGVASTGMDAMRPAYVAQGARLEGFTLTGGRSRGSSVALTLIGETLGGGVFSEAGATLINCVISNNGALNGGGACGWGTYENCRFVDNSSSFSGGGSLYGYFRDSTIGPGNESRYGAGVSQAELDRCEVVTNWAAEAGGGAYASTLRRCRISDNTSSLGGGGITDSSAENCLILFNTALNGNGGGARGSTIRNCVIRGNSASGGGGGTYWSYLRDSIIYFNYASSYDNVLLGSGSCDYSCTTPDPGGVGNITNDPQFVLFDADPADFHLQRTSPCIDVGDPASTVTNDFDGVARPLEGNGDATNRVDMGAYEYEFSPLLIAPALTNVPAQATTGRQVFVTASVAWTATTNRPWLVVTSGSSGSTNGTVIFRVTANYGAARTGAIVVAGSGISRTCTVVQAAFKSLLSDYDGDGRCDMPVFNPPNGAWYIYNASTATPLAWNLQWGWSTAKPVVGDYNGDGAFDLAVFDTVGGYWYIRTLAGTVLAWANQWGWSTAKPVAGDYNGDGVWDQAVFDTVGGYWYIKSVSGPLIAWANQWGWSTAKPVPGDYNGDGVWDQAVFDTSGGVWYIKTLSGASILWQNAWGWSTAKPVPGDYDGDGRYDQAVFDTAGGFWYIKSVSGTVITWANQWGWSTAKPMPGDYNGDGKFDLAVVDTATGRWYVKSLDGTVIAWNVNWGWAGAVFPTLGD